MDGSKQSDARQHEKGTKKMRRKRDMQKVYSCLSGGCNLLRLWISDQVTNFWVHFVGRLYNLFFPKPSLYVTMCCEAKEDAVQERKEKALEITKHR